MPYRETIRATVSKRGRHKKQSGGHGQFGDVVLEVKPLPRGAGFVFDDTITGGVVPKNYIPAVEAGVREALKNGPLGGFPVVDIGVTLTDGSYHDVDSSDQAFKMAGILGMREALPEARPVLLEPVLRVRIAVPNDNTARVNAIVSGRRGQLMGYDARPGWNGWDVVEALIPEAEIADLIIELRSATAGVGTFTAEFDKMAEVTGPPRRRHPGAGEEAGGLDDRSELDPGDRRRPSVGGLSGLNECSDGKRRCGRRR